MEKDYFSIGEISKIKGITIKALRFYDRIGLLKPSYKDPFSRYRYYHLSQFVYLDIIKAARAMDISPKDLIPFFKSKDSQSLIEFLDRHKEATRRKIEELSDIICGIDEVKNSVKRAETAAGENGVYYRDLAERYAVTLPFAREKPPEEYSLDYSELYLTMSRYGLVSSYEDGLLFSRNDRGEFDPAYLCVFVAAVKDCPEYRRIPAGNYACVRYTQEDAGRQQQKLWKELEEKHQDPLGLVQIGLMTDLLAEEPAFWELQARV